MRITDLFSDDALLSELGGRAEDARVRLEMTQAQFAQSAGISKRTVERIENGESVQLQSFIRYLRALHKLDGLEHLLPEPPVSPIRLLKKSPRKRVRVSSTARPAATASKPRWKWGDEK